jgi:hypothetical protein
VIPVHRPVAHEAENGAPPKKEKEKSNAPKATDRGSLFSHRQVAWNLDPGERKGKRLGHVSAILDRLFAVARPKQIHGRSNFNWVPAAQTDVRRDFAAPRCPSV